MITRSQIEQTLQRSERLSVLPVAKIATEETLAHVKHELRALGCDVEETEGWVSGTRYGDSGDDRFQRVLFAKM